MYKIITICFCLLFFSNTNFAQGKSSYEKFLDEVWKDFGSKATKLNKDYNLGKYGWDYSQDTGKLIFSENGVAKVIATAQIAGSYSSISNTWMWSWANKSVDNSVKKDISKVKEFGKKNQFKELTTAQFECDQDHAWTMTTAAGYLIKAKGAYQGPYPNGYAYFLITDIKWADAK